MATVLVTGGSGFLGAHCVAQLLAAGHSVRTTVRSEKRQGDVRAMVERAGVDPGPLAFAVADLERDDGWTAAVDGCRYVLHVASPFPTEAPKHEDEVIVPAREGALRVLRAAKAAGVERVVLTSSFAAVGYGHPPQDAPFDETAWTDVNAPGVRAYVKSKTLAERAAWDFVAGGGPELSVVNPVGIFGPVLGPDFSTSIVLVKRLLDGAMPGCPRLFFGAVDVRDTADLHLRAMVDPAAKGERFIAVSGDTMPVVEMARVLRERLGPAGRRVPTRQLPDFLVRLTGLVDPAVKQIVGDLGKKRRMTGEKAKRVLGWSPRSPEDAIVATGESLVALGLLA